VSSYFKFLRRVRIHGRECGAVARALPHKIEANPLSAADKKVLSTTNERKVMSNSTFFKRIALTAIAALGFGMLSVAPSNAVVAAHTITIDNDADAIFTNDTATAVLTHTFLNQAVLDSVTVQALLTSGSNATKGQTKLSVSESSTSSAADFPDYTYNAAGVNDIVASAERLLTPENTGAAPESFTVSNASASTVVTSKITARFVAPSAAGTYKVTFFTFVRTAAAAGTTATVTAGPSVVWTITVTDRDTTATAASTTTLRTGTKAIADGTAEGTDSATVASALVVDEPAFTAFVRLKNTAGASNASTARESLTAVVDGEAYVSISASDEAAAKSKVLTFNADAAPDTDGTPLYIYSTGTAGTATVTIKTVTSGLTVGTKTVTFYGSKSSVAIGTSVYKIARTGGNAVAGMFTVKVFDSSGTRTVPGVTFANVSSAPDQIASVSCTDTTGDASTADGVYSCSVTSSATSTSGGKATLTIQTLAYLSSTTYIGTTYDVTLGGGVSTVVLSTDKTTYQPGEAMIITATAKDASGNPVYDSLSGPTLAVNKSIGGTLTMNAYIGGVSTSQTRSSTTGLVTAANTVYAPAASGEFRVSGLAGDAASTPISVTSTVGDDAATAAANAASDAAAEAIDAANAATDAANLAAEAADAATVAAEEARDAADAATAAVEELATQVATLMAALKAQITTLANTVAKIAKKVKA
jgi:hypothetical protein